MVYCIKSKLYFKHWHKGHIKRKQSPAVLFIRAKLKFFIENNKNPFIHLKIGILFLFSCSLITVCPKKLFHALEFVMQVIQKCYNFIFLVTRI